MNSNKRISLGYGLLCFCLGGLWLMHAMEILPWRLSDYVFSWRFLLVVIGLLITIKNPRSVFGLLVLAVGGISTMTYYWNLPDGWEDFVPPIALMIVGLILLLRSNPERAKFDTSDENVINRATVLSKFDTKVNCMLFKGGYISALFGRNRIDFSVSHLGKESVPIYCSNIFGNSTLIIPKGWDVKFKNKNIFGSNEDARNTVETSMNKEGILEISGTNFLGKLRVVNNEFSC